MALPYLYLKGLSSGDFGEVMPVLLGKDATMGFSANTVLRLRKQWKGKMEQWLRRRLDSKNYVYIWADGVYLSARLEDEKQCLLVIMGATPEGKKELVGFTTGYRESTQSWRELLLDLKARSLSIPPKLAMGMGPWGFGVRLNRYDLNPNSNDVGFTKPSMSWINCPNPYRAKPKQTSRIFGWPITRKRLTKPLICL
jgi:hypothetical protein